MVRHSVKDTRLADADVVTKDCHWQDTFFYTGQFRGLSEKHPDLFSCLLCTGGRERQYTLSVLCRESSLPVDCQVGRDDGTHTDHIV